MPATTASSFRCRGLRRASGVHQRRRTRPPHSHPETLLALYLGDWETVRAAGERLHTLPIEPANPYWAEHALTFADPDGFRVVLAAEEWNADDELTDRLADTGLRRYRQLLRRLGD